MHQTNFCQFLHFYYSLLNILSCFSMKKFVAKTVVKLYNLTQVVIHDTSIEHSMRERIWGRLEQ